ncbi:Na(+)-dependent transporter [Zobellella endophytica]|uniref:Na(+)-dependent transporter n=1 Tax=Zobellella endophytica TaxID=2116700 RepID=A0A2P7R8N0_9GAMM|nr:bile acid:sodium symporter [Zobellella endophytica]PSJ46559.1 Na(+)-dependent transporter [Zobellella endophytica]
MSDILTTLLLPLMLALMTLVMGMTLEVSHFSRLLGTPGPLLLGLGMQWLLLPLLAWLLIVMLELPTSIAAGVILVAAAPGGATSNLFSFLADGDTALSVSLTALVGLLTPVWMPLAVMTQLHWLGLDSHELSLPLGRTMVQLALIGILPVAIGMGIRQRYRRWVERHQSRLKQLVSLSFMLVLLALVARNLKHLPSLFGPPALAMLLLCTLALTCGYLAARLAKCPEASCRSLAFEVGIQNGATAMLVAYTQLGSEALAVMALLYGILMNIPALALLAWFRKKGRRGAVLSVQ